MNVKVVSGQSILAYKINFLEFYNELKNIEIPQVFIEYTEIMNRPHKEIYIEKFYTNPSKKGYGTKAMLEILKIADKYKIVISLTPNTDLFDSKVSKFWRKLGFGKDPKDFDNRIYLRYYEGYERKNQNEASNIKENDEKTFLEKMKTFFK